MTSLQTQAKLSQWDALLLEALRARGWSDEELLNIGNAGELPADDSDFHFDFGQLAKLAAEQPEVYKYAVTQGYQIKYNTLRGIRSWIAVALGIEPRLELEEGQEAVEAVLTGEEKRRLQTVLSFGWQINSIEGTEGLWRIEPVQR